MENLRWLNINQKENLVSFHSVDTMSVLPFLRGRDFKIVELYPLKDNVKKNLLRKNEEKFWVRKNHYLEINSLIEDDQLEQISIIEMNFDCGGGLTFNLGKLTVRLNDRNSLRKISIKILEQYGYFSAAEIWNFVSKQNCDMPIHHVLGMEQKDINDSFISMLKQGKMVDEEL